MSETLPPGQVVAQRDNSKLGMWIFLGGEVVFFATLILTFIYFRLTNAAEFAAFQRELSVPLIAINTFILIASSYLVVRALEAIGRGSQAGLRNNLAGVVVLGALFLGGQGFEWATLFGAGVSVESVLGTPFFTITGLHGTHVFVGLIWAVVVLLSGGRGAYTARNHLGVENFGLYWHFVDIVWVVLFTLIYLV